jgi:hypothetical protein
MAIGTANRERSQLLARVYCNVHIYNFLLLFPITRANAPVTLRFFFTVTVPLKTTGKSANIVRMTL